MLTVRKAGSCYGRAGYEDWFVMRSSDATLRVSVHEFCRHPMRALRYLYSTA